VIFYALVAADCPDWAIDLWPSHEAAEAALREVLADEPAFRDLLSIVPVSLSGRKSEASKN
jgi:hypothetical protein